MNVRPEISPSASYENAFGNYRVLCSVMVHVQGTDLWNALIWGFSGWCKDKQHSKLVLDKEDEKEENIFTFALALKS